jgi:hypothetical protein
MRGNNDEQGMQDFCDYVNIGPDYRNISASRSGQGVFHDRVGSANRRPSEAPSENHDQP